MVKAHQGSGISDNPLDENSPAVLAYRVGELEKASRQGFKELAEKLEAMTQTYATHKDMETVRTQAKMEHDAIRYEIDLVKDEVHSMKKRSWINSTLSAIFGAVLALLVANAFTHWIG